MGDRDKGLSSAPIQSPKSGWSYMVPPSLPMPDSCPFESWMMPWALPILLPTISRKAAPVATSDTTSSRCSDSPATAALAGYDDTNDAERLSQDPAMRVVVGWQGSDRNAASTNTVSRFETETLTQQDNLQGLARMNPQWVEDAMAHTPHQRVILDMDSSESPVHGHQEGAAYNGHFECVCYHPLFTIQPVRRL